MRTINNIGLIISGENKKIANLLKSIFFSLDELNVLLQNCFAEHTIENKKNH
jgi:hypothetical protein